MKNKIWCRHIKWHVGTYSGASYAMLLTQKGLLNSRVIVKVTKAWKLCPICGLFRPGYWMNPKTGNIGQIPTAKRPKKGTK